MEYRVEEYYNKEQIGFLSCNRKYSQEGIFSLRCILEKCNDAKGKSDDNNNWDSAEGKCIGARKASIGMNKDTNNGYFYINSSKSLKLQLGSLWITSQT